VIALRVTRSIVIVEVHYYSKLERSKYRKLNARLALIIRFRSSSFQERSSTLSSPWGMPRGDGFKQSTWPLVVLLKSNGCTRKEVTVLRLRPLLKSWCCPSGRARIIMASRPQRRRRAGGPQYPLRIFGTCFRLRHSRGAQDSNFFYTECLSREVAESASRSAAVSSARGGRCFYIRHEASGKYLRSRRPAVVGIDRRALHQAEFHQRRA